MRRVIRTFTVMLVITLGGCSVPASQETTSSEPADSPTTSSLALQPSDTEATTTSSTGAGSSTTNEIGSRRRLTAYPVGEDGAPLGYYEYLPPGYGDGQPRPLLLALHGFGGNGDGTRVQLENIFETGIPLLIRSDEWPAERPFVVLMPQHLFSPGPDDEDWCAGVETYVGSCASFAQSEHGHPGNGLSPCTTPNEVDEFLSYALDNYDIDVDHVYLTGLSCGGYAVYEYLAQYGAATVAAAVPIAGDARPSWETAGCGLGAVPLWAFEGDADDVTQPEGTIEPISALAECTDPPPAEVKLTVYPGVDHDSWDATYDLSAGNDIYTWLLQHNRAG